MAREMKNSGIEWVGEIPKDWDTLRIKNLFVYRNEKNFKPLDSVNLISLYTDLGVVQHSDLESTTGNKASNADGYKLVYKNDIVVNIILCWMGAIGRSAYNGVTSPAYDVYAPKKGTNSRFYHYLFRTQGFSGDCYKVGRGIMAMRWRTYSDQFKSIRVVAPPSNEQKRIVDFLDQKCAEIDAVITKTKETIEEYKKLKQSIITEAVTKGIRGERPTKDSGVEWIRDIPIEWKVSPLHYYVELNKNTLENDTSADYEFNYVEIGAVTLENGISKYQHYKFANAPSRARRIVQPNDIIISTVRTYLKAIAIVPEKENVIVSTGFAVLTPKNIGIDYLGFALKSDYFIHMVTANSVGINYPAINSSDLVKLKIAIPTEEEQEEIANYLDKKCTEIDTLIARKTALLEEMESYKKSVIYEYVTGKKEVSV